MTMILIQITIILVRQEEMIPMIANNRNIPNIKKVKDEIIIILKLVYFFSLLLLCEFYALLL